MSTLRIKTFFIILLVSWTFVFGLFFFLDYAENKTTFKKTAKYTGQLKIDNRIAIEQCINKQSEKSLALLSVIWALGATGLWFGFKTFGKQKMVQLQKEGELEISQEKFNSYFENNLAVMLLIDPGNKKIIDANNAACKFYKYSKQELLKMTIADINVMPPEEINEKMKLAIMQKADHLSFQHKLSDGKIKDVEVYASPFVFKGGKMMSIIVHDVTQRNIAEQALRKSREKHQETSKLLEALFDSIPDVIGVQDTEYRIISYNKAGYDSLGMEAKQVIGKKCYELIGNGQVCKSCATAEVYKTLKPAKIEKYDEQLNLWLEVRAYPVFDESGKLFQVIKHLRDITERKKTVDELKKSKEKAEESDRLKSAFLANMSHEIRTPMNAILGFTQLLKANSLNAPKRNEYIEIIKNSGNHLLDIINDIIDISKIDAHQMDIAETAFDLNRFLLEIYQLFQSIITQKAKSNVQLILNENSKSKFIISTDKTRLRQILINLVGNAVKFSPNGSVEFGYEKKDGDTLLFYIKDTGIGMTKKELAFVFDRFRQGDESWNRPFGGTGLGLAISKEFAELIGGRIWAESIKGKGSTFFLAIPLKQDFSPKTETIIEKTQNNEPLKGKTILIVEDDEYSSLILSELLKPFKLNIVQAVDGMQAIKMCIDKPEIDLVLMDIQLPVLDGLQATQRIKKIKPGLPIIAQTANAMQEDREKALTAGCDDYISKPIDSNELIQKIGKYIA